MVKWVILKNILSQTQVSGSGVCISLEGIRLVVLVLDVRLINRPRGSRHTDELGGCCILNSCNLTWIAIHHIHSTTISTPDLSSLY